MIAHSTEDQPKLNLPIGNQEQTAKMSDFSIDHILNRAGPSENPKICDDASEVKFRWLQCSRYCPPRVPSKFFYSF